MNMFDESRDGCARTPEACGYDPNARVGSEHVVVGAQTNCSADAERTHVTDGRGGATTVFDPGGS